MKSFFVVVAVSGLLAAVLFAPVGGRSFWTRAQERGLPAAAARTAAHGMRAGWDFLVHSPKHASRKAQAAAAQTSIHRASREGIVAQAPKEKLEQTDRAALDALVKRR